MARLILLSISVFLLLALVVESSIAWPYPDDKDIVAEKMPDTDDDGETLRDLMVINEKAMKDQGTDDGDDDTAAGEEENAKEEVVQEEDEEETAVAMANVDDKLDADIEQAG